MKGVTAFVGVLLGLFALAFGLRLWGSPVFSSMSPKHPPDTTLGVAHEGVHACHFAGVACFDHLMTYVLAATLAWASGGSVTFWLIVLLIVSEIQHHIYGIPTATQRWLFGY